MLKFEKDHVLEAYYHDDETVDKLILAEQLAIENSASKSYMNSWKKQIKLFHRLFFHQHFVLYFWNCGIKKQKILCHGKKSLVKT